jgi:DUF971 family protein
MDATGPSAAVPLALRKEGDSLVIEWRDGCVAKIGWQELRDACPCATCREERQKPPDPLRILKPAELDPLAPVSMPRVGRYAYRIVWSDGHDTGIYTLDHLRELSQCP